MEFWQAHTKELLQLAFVVVGGLIGIVASQLAVSRQLRNDRKRRQAEHCLRGIQLAHRSLSHLRVLLYAKLEGPKGMLSMPENPVDELMGLAVLHLPEVVPLVQELHNKQQGVFERHIQDEVDPVAYALHEGKEFERIVNSIAGCIEEVGKRSISGD